MSDFDEKAKYKYSPESTIHNPIQVDDDGTVHTWTLTLNGQEYRVTREVWEAYRAEMVFQKVERARKKVKR